MKKKNKNQEVLPGDQIDLIIERLRNALSPEALEAAELSLEPINEFDPVLAELLRESSEASKKISKYLMKRHFSKNSN